MRFLARAFLAVLFFFLFLLITGNSHFVTREVFAEGEFVTNYEVTYNVGETGTTIVTQQVELENKTPNFYADQFELKIGSTKITDVQAKDNTGPLETEVKFENNLTTIKVKFNQKVIGAGKTLPWTLSYISNELATKNGQIWEISIPRLARSQDIGKYKAKVTVPQKFGPIAFAIPNPKEEEKTATTQTFLFDKDQLLESGIAMSFGEKQVFSFKLNYYLQNNNVTSQTLDITLPPDNNYQKVVLEALNPEPENVIVDEDGNFRALYKLSPRTKLDITAEGSVEVFHKPFRKIYTSLAKNEKEIYTQPQRYWETDNAFIKDKARELKTPENIYGFVVNFLSYSQNRLNSKTFERKGAASAYAAPDDAVCMEFTDLFIAIARAANIPAREVTGFAYTQNERLRPLSLALNEGDILHAWPEYWDDERGWVQIDPTWASTSGGLDFFNKLDFNHITFTQRGVSSTNPSPPGAFKREDQKNKKSVFVEFSQNLPEATVNPKIILNAPERFISGISTRVEALIENLGSTTIYNGDLSLKSSILQPSGPNSHQTGILPPFSKKTFNFRLTSTDFLQNTKDILVLSFNDLQTTKEISIEPIYNLIFTPIFLIGALLAFIIISIGFLSYKKLFKKVQNKISFPVR